MLTALQSDTRQDLRDVLEGLGTALSSEPSAADDRDADPSARGETAAESFNDAYDDIGPAERAQSQVNEALLGARARAGPRAADRGRRQDRRRPRAQRDPAQGAGRRTSTRRWPRSPPRSRNLRASIRELAPTLENANGALASLNEAFPPTRAFAREILPGVRETPATIDASFPWIEQARGLMSEAELQGLARDLSPATRDLARLTDEAIELLPQTDLASKCASRVVLPTGDVVIQDEFQTGRENYKDFFYAMVGLAGEGQNFDGNGMYVRFQTGGGSQQVSLGQGSAGSPPQFGGLPTPPLGNRPFYPGKLPPYKPERALLQAEAARPQRPGRRQGRAEPGRRRPRPATARTRAAADAARQDPPVRHKPEASR